MQLRIYAFEATCFFLFFVRVMLLVTVWKMPPGWVVVMAARCESVRSQAIVQAKAAPGRSAKR
jgi:hypothetical protein